MKPGIGWWLETLKNVWNYFATQRICVNFYDTKPTIINIVYMISSVSVRVTIAIQNKRNFFIKLWRVLHRRERWAGRKLLKTILGRGEKLFFFFVTGEVLLFVSKTRLVKIMSPVVYVKDSKQEVILSIVVHPTYTGPVWLCSSIHEKTGHP